MSSTKIKDYIPGCVYMYTHVAAIVVAKNVGIVVYPKQIYTCPSVLFCIDSCSKIIKYV
jgi:hypothetical protein